MMYVCSKCVTDWHLEVEFHGTVAICEICNARTGDETVQDLILVKNLNRPMGLDLEPANKFVMDQLHKLTPMESENEP